MQSEAFVCITRGAVVILFSGTDLCTLLDYKPGFKTLWGGGGG
jgi:hypothetical protein